MLPDEPARPQAEEHPGLPGCYRHPERETGIACSRCGRPICPQCMVSASVGFHCPECVGGGARQVRAATTRFGGRPVGDEALVTKILIGINLLVFVLTQYVHPEWRQLLSVFSYPSQNGAPALGVAAGPDQWYRLVSAMFVHLSEFHIGANMVSLWVLGPQLEKVLGRLRFLGLYFVSGVVGNALVFLASDGNAYSAGASGAIFGLLGATAVLFRASRVPLGPVIALLVFNLVITFSVPQIDWRAHVGGLVAGTIAGVGLMYAPRAHRNLVQGLTVAAMVGLALVIMLIETARLGA
ncbi:rhomboid family intramembrane serine protease [Kitasatospora sp. MAP5-34]|uniref:rhomboid family intramembrane serine protease n=1 Tax=Kitasatospora sp. MAP5-34 TaxID=3035102 RepID=UPI00247433D4|nr:rhomboid family intramembrane serine protease [Kitasatospora sp. MAP5-34]MDH6576408.1 membrane associated rhomboid family serine protease [Kitasatospora sp. MAP5-34]